MRYKYVRLRHNEPTKTKKTHAKTVESSARLSSIDEQNDIRCFARARARKDYAATLVRKCTHKTYTHPFMCHPICASIVRRALRSHSFYRQPKPEAEYRVVGRKSYIVQRRHVRRVLYIYIHIPQFGSQSPHRSEVDEVYTHHTLYTMLIRCDWWLNAVALL